MKKVIAILFTAVMLSGGQSIQISESSTKNSSTVTDVASSNNTNDAQAQKLMARLNEIKDLDKSQLTRQERRDLRKEVLNIKQELKQQDSVIVISGTALLIIVLLL